jgi:hypothetical protein
MSATAAVLLPTAAELLAALDEDWRLKERLYRLAKAVLKRPATGELGISVTAGRHRRKEKSTVISRCMPMLIYRCPATIAANTCDPD